MSTDPHDESTSPSSTDGEGDQTDVPDAVMERAALMATYEAPTTETEERFARAGADRLSEEMVAEATAGATGARAAAFFDLDKTIIARSSTLMMGRTLFRDGLISPAIVMKGLYAQAVYQLVGADHDKMEQMRHALLDLSKGWEAERVRRLAREAIEEVIAPLVYQEALDLFAEHRRHGRDIWIVSSSGEELVAPFADHLAIRDVIATRSAVDEDGRYDGTLEFYAYAANKATAIRQVAEARGYDLGECYAYSDSITDLPMLMTVGHPVAVNPDRELRAAAIAMEWETQDFHSPVSLRQRLPDFTPKSAGILAATVGVLAAALVGWRYVLRGQD